MTRMAASVEVLEERIGRHSGRLRSVEELLALRGKEVWLVTAPQEKQGEEYNSLGTSLITNWDVGSIYNQQGKEITSINDVQGDEHLFTVHGTKIYTDNNEEKRVIISLLDYNILPNTYNNHSIFDSEDNAQKYRLWLRMKYPIHKHLEMLEGRVINGRKVIWDVFLKEGIKDYQGT